MNFRFFALILFFFFPLLIAGQEKDTQETAEKPALPHSSDQFRKDFSRQIRRGTAERKDYDTCQKVIDQLELAEQKQPFYLLLAQYHRVIDRESIKALEVLAPLVVSAEDAEKWIAEQHAAAQNAFEEWSKEFDAAKSAKKKKEDLPKRPDGLFVEFPAMETWKLDDSNAAVGIEIARCLIVLNRHEEALKVINTVGENCDKEYKILAAECAADLMAWTKMYENAVEFYNMSLKYFRAIRENGDEFVILLPDEQQVIKNRINYKLGAIRDLAEQGRFTPDWLAYRNAQRKHFEEESLLEAFWMYSTLIKDYPNSFCAEASECYLIKILTLFSNPAVFKEAAKRYDILLDQLEDAKAQWRQAKRTGMAVPFITGLEAYVERLKFVVKMFEKTPFGPKALKVAEERAEKFIEKNKYGLYRGEVLLDVGTAYLVSNFDVENGEKWLVRAAEWFDNVQNFDKELKDFELPESIKKVLQPPKDERFKDRWNNVKMAKPKPGDFFNRRTCSWYIGSKQKDIALLQGLIAFANNENDKAKKYWDKIAVIDKDFYAEQEKTGWGSATTHYRLTQRIKYQPGALFATTGEMAAFKDKKRRLAVLLADLYYLAEEPEKALVMYRLLESGKWGAMTYNEKAYICFAIFSCLCWNTGVDEIAYIEPKLKAFVGTPTEARIVHGFANRLKTGENIVLLPKKINAYEYLIQKFPKTEEAEYAAFVLGLIYIDLAKTAINNQNREMAVQYLQKVYELYNIRLQDDLAGSYRVDMEKIISKIKIFFGNTKSQN